MQRVFPAFLSLLALTACVSEESEVGDSNSDATAGAGIAEGSPEAVGVLAFINDASTDVAVLDDEVPLPSHAANNLIAHRNGADGELGTRDDDLYDTVAEILDVPQIGRSRLQALIDYADRQGYVPSGSDQLGVYDGVPFTVDEAEQTLALVNTATLSVLDDSIGLDRRAVDSILEARTIESVLELSELYYVGKTALTKLRDWAAPAVSAGEGDDCESTAGCESGLTCMGIPFDDSAPIGKCVNTANIPGEGEQCGVFAGGCNEGLECVGTTVNNGEGYCSPQWMVGIFSATAVVAIPDNSAQGVSIPLQVYGLATVPEDIVLTLAIEHPRPQDLIVTLTASNGSSDVVWNHEPSPELRVSDLWGIERDNFVNGEWTLHIADTVSGETGQLNRVELLVSSRFD